MSKANKRVQLTAPVVLVDGLNKADWIRWKVSQHVFCEDPVIGKQLREQYGAEFDVLASEVR